MSPLHFQSSSAVSVSVSFCSPYKFILLVVEMFLKITYKNFKKTFSTRLFVWFLGIEIQRSSRVCPGPGNPGKPWEALELFY